VNDYEQAVLRAMSSDPDPVGWYKLEQRLSVMTLETREYLPETLRSLASQGLIDQHEHPVHSYALTPAGQALMQNHP
jgi:DNA-binding HxlR family transcriptional regulator